MKERLPQRKRWVRILWLKRLTNYSSHTLGRKDRSWPTFRANLCIVFLRSARNNYYIQRKQKLPVESPGGASSSHARENLRTSEKDTGDAPVQSNIVLYKK